MDDSYNCKLTIGDSDTGKPNHGRHRELWTIAENCKTNHAHQREINDKASHRIR
jgi:hypothetical protein